MNRNKYIIFEINANYFILEVRLIMRSLEDLFGLASEN